MIASIIMGLLFNYSINFFYIHLNYDQNLKSVYLIGIVLFGLISYLLIALMIKAFKISDIKLKY